MSDLYINSKLVLLGESAVGKSSIVLRFVKAQFHEFQEATIGGQERYHSLAPMYYRGAQAAIIVYDITSDSSFQRAKAWVTELNEKASSVKVLALAGNKLDLEAQRAVTTEEAQNYATENGLIFMETSAKVCTNVTELFTALALRLPRDVQAQQTVGQQLEGPDATTGRQCCR